MKELFQNFYRWFRLLSIDIVLGSLAVSYYFFHLLGKSVQNIFWLLLASIVWLVYIADHLADEYKQKKTSSPEPKVLIFDKPYIFIPLGIVITTNILLLIIFFTPEKIILFGIPGGLLTLLYLILNQVQNRSDVYFFPRELTIALLYLYGTAGLPVMLAAPLSLAEYIYLTGFLLLIISNILIYSLFDSKSDKIKNVKSIAVKFGIQKTQLILRLLTSSSIILFLGLLFVSDYSKVYSIIGLAIGIVLSGIIYSPVFFSKKARYGKVADLCFLFPGITLFMS